MTVLSLRAALNAVDPAAVSLEQAVRKHPFYATVDKVRSPALVSGPDGSSHPVPLQSVPLWTAYPYSRLRALGEAAVWPQGQPPFEPTENYDYPSNRENGWSEELQGVTHDDDCWYFSQKDRLLKFPVGYDLNRPLDDDPTVLTAGIPRHDLDGSVLGADGSVVDPLPPGITGSEHPGRDLQVLPDEIRVVYSGTYGYYHHFGDPDWHSPYLYVPLESELSPRLPPKLLVMDAQLRHVATAMLSLQASEASWAAINPLNGLLYSSEFNASKLCVYRPVVGARVGQGPVAFELQPVGFFPLYDYDGSERQLSRIQGGVFSRHGHLYLVSDVSENGVLAFDMSTGRRALWPLQVDYQPTKHVLFAEVIGDELEGITIWDQVESQGAPGIRGQLHLIMIDNYGSGDDDLYFKHYRVKDPHDISHI